MEIIVDTDIRQDFNICNKQNIDQSLELTHDRNETLFYQLIESQFKIGAHQSSARSKESEDASLFRSLRRIPRCGKRCEKLRRRREREREDPEVKPRQNETKGTKSEAEATRGVDFSLGSRGRGTQRGPQRTSGERAGLFCPLQVFTGDRADSAAISHYQTDIFVKLNFSLRKPAISTTRHCSGHLRRSCSRIPVPGSRYFLFR